MSEISQLVQSPGWWFTTVVIGPLVGVVSGLMVAKPQVFLPTVRWAEVTIVGYVVILVVTAIIATCISGLSDDIAHFSFLASTTQSPFWRGFGAVYFFILVGIMILTLMYNTAYPAVYKVVIALAIAFMNMPLVYISLAAETWSFRATVSVFLFIAEVMLIFSFISAAVIYVTGNAAKLFMALFRR